MESIILDTNVVSELMRSQPDSGVLEWFAQRPAAVFYTTAITKGEILLGIAMLPAGKRRDGLAKAAEMMFSADFAGRCLPFDESCADHYAAVVAGRRRAGFTATTEDAQIASIALSCGFALATRNTRDFMYIDGVQLYNPWQT